MKKALFIILLLVSWTAGAQNASRIRRDATYLSADGNAPTLHAADSAALAGLAARIAARLGLSEALGSTYLEDLRQVSSRLVEGRYTVLRYLEASRIDEVFSPRRERIARLTRQAEHSGDAQYYSLAYTLARSVPGYPADRLEFLREHAAGGWTLQDFVSREADAVLAALEPRPAAREHIAVKTAPQVRQEEEVEHITVRDTVVVERDLGRIVVEHRYGRRDTMVVIPGSREDGVATVPLKKAAPSLPVGGFVLAQAGILPEFSYGTMFGLGGAYWGGYLRFSSNFRPAEPFAYDCKSDGSTEYGVFWSSGARAVSRFTLTGGGWIPCTDWLRIYAGGGFGRRTVCWQDSRGGWARVTDYSAAGLTLEAGIVLNLGHFALSLGGETLAFRSCGLTVGAGFSF